MTTASCWNAIPRKSWHKPRVTNRSRSWLQFVAPEKDPEASLEQILAANQVFHLRLCELAGNQRVMGQLNLTLGYVARLDTLCTQTVPGWIGHAEILRAIERREPAEARHAMQVHVDASRDKMVKLFSA